MEALTIDHTLQAENGYIIQTYGKKLLSLNLGRHLAFSWHFFTFDVTKLIIGADFLSNLYLLVDLNRKCLLNGRTDLTSPAINAPVTDMNSIRAIKADAIYHNLLRTFTNITNPYVITKGKT